MPGRRRRAAAGTRSAPGPPTTAGASVVGGAVSVATGSDAAGVARAARRAHRGEVAPTLPDGRLDLLRRPSSSGRPSSGATRRAPPDPPAPPAARPRRPSPPRPRRARSAPVPANPRHPSRPHQHHRHVGQLAGQERRRTLLGERAGRELSKAAVRSCSAAFCASRSSRFCSMRPWVLRRLSTTERCDHGGPHGHADGREPGTRPPGCRRGSGC